MKAVINNNKIKVVFDGSPECVPIHPTDTIIEVPYGFTCKEGDDIRMWDSNFNLRNAEDLVAEGYIILLPTQKIVDHKVVDKTLQEQYDEGIYIPESGWTVYKNQLLDMAGVKTAKYNEIQSAFQNMFSIGLVSTTLDDKVVDCRVGVAGVKDDIDVIKVLLEVMKANGIAKYDYRLKDNTYYKDATQAQYQSVIDEMGLYGVQQYQKRSALNDAITAATTFEQVESISW